MSISQHVCVFYKSADELWNLCVPLICDGARDGFRWLYVADEHSLHDAKSALERHLRQAEPAGEVVDAGPLGLLDTPVSVATIIAKLRAQAESTQAAGFSGLLVLVEMTWLLHILSGTVYPGEYEAVLHELLASVPMRAVCLYNQHIFPASIMLDALRTHPCIFAADGLHSNPHFLPPAAFLGGNARAQLQWWLAAISPALADTWHQGSELTEPGYQAHSATRHSNMIPRAPAYQPDLPAPLVASNIGQQHWKIHCLGRLQVYRQDNTPVRWNVIAGATLKTKTLFAYLLHRGQEGATAEEIAAMLWPKANSTEQSLNRLYHTVHCLRMALSPELTSSRDSPFVLNDDQCYYLALPEHTWIDMPVFKQLCYNGEKLLRDSNDEQALVCHLAAESLYGGDLLSDVPVQYAESIDQDWCWSRRYWLQEMYLKMLTYTAGIYRRRNDARRALTYCERVLQTDPCFERGHQEMMRLFHLTGRRDALERQYRMCSGALRRYEERSPSPATQALYQSLMAAP